VPFCKRYKEKRKGKRKEKKEQKNKKIKEGRGVPFGLAPHVA
jgi:hypothetical protein